MHILELDNIFHFLIVGKYPSSIEIMNFIREITKICQKESIKDIMILNFDTLCLSKQSFEKCCLVPLWIFFVDSDLLHSRMFNLEQKVINKIRVSAGDIVAQTSELSESPGLNKPKFPMQRRQVQRRTKEHSKTKISEPTSKTASRPRSIPKENPNRL